MRELRSLGRIALMAGTFIALPFAARATDTTVQTLPDGARLVRPAPVPEMRVERYLKSPGRTVNASDAVDEMLDDLAADLAKLGAADISPILINRVQVSSNIAPTFAPILEARLIGAITRATSASVSRCLECEATVGHVENEVWVVSHGITRLEDLRRIAAKYGAKTVLSVTLTLQGEAEGLALDVELMRPENAAIVFGEGYRFNPTTVALYRGVDRAQYRADRLKELQDRLDGRPQYGYGFGGGMLYVPIVDSNKNKSLVAGVAGGFRMYEKFGESRQFRAGFDVGGYLNDEKLAGGILGGSLAMQVTESNAYTPALLLGGSGGVFVTGTAGNSPYVALSAEAFFIRRIGFRFDAMYLFPFAAKTIGTVGGFCPGGSLEVSW